MTVSKLFINEHDSWGLRGDPYLWNELKDEFVMDSDEIEVAVFKNRLIELFQLKTGVSIDSDDQPCIEKYAHGGMSSGCISTYEWRERLIPMLLENLKEVKEKAK